MGASDEARDSPDNRPEFYRAAIPERAVAIRASSALDGMEADAVCVEKVVDRQDFVHRIEKGDINASDRILHVTRQVPVERNRLDCGVLILFHGEVVGPKKTRLEGRFIVTG
jgi:hypothetical protein